MGAAEIEHLYSRQPLKANEFQSPKEQIHNTGAAGFKAHPHLLDKSAQTRDVHCTTLNKINYQWIHNPLYCYSEVLLMVMY